MIRERVQRRNGGPVTGDMTMCESYGGHAESIMCAHAANIFGMPPDNRFMLLIAEEPFEGSKPVLIVDFMHSIVDGTHRFPTGRFTTLEGMISALLNTPYNGCDCSRLFGEVVHIGWEACCDSH